MTTELERYNPASVESRWQRRWEADGLYHAEVDWERPKHYALTMLPYPSGDLHIGHWYAMTPSDARARFMRMQGYNVLFPMASTPSACRRRTPPSRATSTRRAGRGPTSSACASNCAAWAPCSTRAAK